jgi:hypothetical protein
MCVKSDDRCFICDCFFDDPEVALTRSMRYMSNFVCEFCCKFLPAEIIQLANEAIEECTDNGIIYTEKNWHEHILIVSRRDAVFQTRKFKIGDLVKVTSKEFDQAKGWMNAWPLQMNATVGSSYKILDLNNAFGLGVMLDTVKIFSCCYDYPWWVLKKVNNVQTAVTNNNCPRCCSAMTKQMSSDFSGRPFEVMKCQTCGYCK